MQTGACAYGLYLFATNVDGYFEGQQLPDQYTARNITVTIRTIVRGLSYLITFIFAANAVGLGGASYYSHDSMMEECLECIKGWEQRCGIRSMMYSMHFIATGQSQKGFMGRRGAISKLTTVVKIEQLI